MKYDLIDSTDELRESINASSNCPDIAQDEAERLVDLAQRRAQTRGEESALDADSFECVITTDWTGFTSDEFDYDNGHVNEFAMGVYAQKASEGKEATLFKHTVVVQHGWLQTGDGRRNKVEEYVDEEFDKSGPGEFWVPNSAQAYMHIVGLSPQLVHGEPSAADAM